MNKVLEISDFKVGDMVWFCYFMVNKSGNVTNVCRPTLMKIKSISCGQVTIDNSHYFSIPHTTFVFHNRVWDDAERINNVGGYDYLTDINLYFSLSEKESKEKFNKLIEDYTYFLHGLFKAKENKIFSYLL